MTPTEQAADTQRAPADGTSPRCSSLTDLAVAGRSPIGPGGLAELQTRLAVRAVEARDWALPT